MTTLQWLGIGVSFASAISLLIGIMMMIGWIDQ